MAIITTTRGDMDESALVKSEVFFENDTERTTVVEYCLLGCDGPWHRTHEPDAPGVFCAKHIHRSVNMELKIGVAGIGSVGSF
jgi:hypothetical protein